MSIAAHLTIVDNSADSSSIDQLLRQTGLHDIANVITNRDNVGFGRANNQAIHQAASEFHLILNPDVELNHDALVNGIRYLEDHPQVTAISPSCSNAKGETEFLCKRRPAVIDLVLRGFAPAWLKRRFHQRLSRYEYQQLIQDKRSAAVALISGCFMLCRTAPLQRAGGFDERFFLYFEDFALSLELGKQGELHHLPTCRIVHHGGGAARKGLRHILYFAASAFRFYQVYGWKLW